MPRKIENEQDREKARVYGRWWYRQNAEYVKARKEARLAEIKEWFVKYKSLFQCQRCGESDPVTLDFHHRDPNAKEISLTQAVHNGWSIKRILQEAAKCDILCANCHKRLHAAQIHRYMRE